MSGKEPLGCAHAFIARVHMQIFLPKLFRSGQTTPPVLNVPII